MFAPLLPHRHIMELQPSAEEALSVRNVGHKPLTPSKRTQSPSVTGTSVLAVKYDKGVLLVADTLGSYGSMARFKSLSRLRAVGENIVIGGSGEYSDFQYIHELLIDRTIEDFCADDPYSMTPLAAHHYLSRIMYQRRNKFDPLWNEIIVAGRLQGENYLGLVDMLGTSFADDYLATGFGAHLAMPLLRLSYKPDMTRDEARLLLEKCMRVLFYRDARTINKIQIADVVDGGINISDPYALQTEWGFGEDVSHASEGTW